MQYMVWEECVVDANGDIDLDRSRYSWSNQKPDLCKSGGGGGTVVQQPASSTQTTKSEPWEKQKPYLEKSFSEAERIYDDGAPGYYPNSTIADVAPETTQALNLMKDRAIAGSPITNAASDELVKTIGGDYLNSNPYLDATFDKAAGKVRSAIDSQFNAAGRSNSGIHSEKLIEGYNDLATNIYGGAYDKERTNQLRGLLFAPQLANQDYYDIDRLSGVGELKEGIDQAKINEDIARYNYDSNKDALSLDDYIRRISGNYGGTTTATGTSMSTTPYSRNTGSGILGGALGGAALGSALKLSNPYTAALAAGGGLLGGFL